MDLEIQNARAAWNWAVDRAQVERLQRVAEPLKWFYRFRGRMQEGAVAFESAARRLAGTDSPRALRVRAKMLGHRSSFHFDFDRERAAQLSREALALLGRPELANQDTRQESAFSERAG